MTVSTVSTDLDLAPTNRSDGLLLPGDVEAVGRYVQAATAESTLRAYATDWAAFQGWCAGRGLASLPAEAGTVAAHLAWLADEGAAPSSVRRRASGIGWAHERAGHERPTGHPGVRATLRGIRRTAATAGHAPRKARALDTASVRALVEDLSDGLAGVRDRAMILVGFALGLRASDVCWLNAADLTVAASRPDGLDVLVRHSKTDQDGVGTTLALAPGVREGTCPVLAVQAWVTEAGLTGGPLFRSVGKGRTQHVGTGRMATSSIARILARAAHHAGLPANQLSPHSLRRGYATSAYANGVPEREIARTGRWRSVTVMRGYDDSSRWADPASGRLGL